MRGRSLLVRARTLASITVRSSFPVLSLLLAACAVVAPDGPSLTGFCTRELRVHLAPTDTTILVDETFTATVALSSCGGRQQLWDTFTWRARDPAVVTVDSNAGTVTGRAPGETWLEITGRYYGMVGGPRVIVRAAP